MTGEEKAAILLLSLDEDLAASVMKNLRPSEIRRLGKQMSRVSNIPAETIGSVAKEFCTMAKELGGMITVRDGAPKNLMVKALGEKDAETIINQVDSGTFDNPIIDKLHEIDPKVMAEFTRTEHPQTIALIMVHLKPEKAAQVLEHFRRRYNMKLPSAWRRSKAYPVNLSRKWQKRWKKN